MLFLELKADRVVCRIGELREPVGHPQDEEDGGIDPDADAGISLFNLDQRCPADRGTRRRDGHGNAPSPPRVSHVMAQLAERALYGGRKSDRRAACPHYVASIFKVFNSLIVY